MCIVNFVFFPPVVVGDTLSSEFDMIPSTMVPILPVLILIDTILNFQKSVQQMK